MSRRACIFFRNNEKQAVWQNFLTDKNQGWYSVVVSALLILFAFLHQTKSIIMCKDGIFA